MNHLKNTSMLMCLLFVAAMAGLAARGITIPVGTEVTIYLIDSVNADTDRLGTTYRASLDEAVVVDGQPVIPRHVDVLTKLTTFKDSKGRSFLTLALSTVTVDGIAINVTSSGMQTSSGSRGGIKIPSGTRSTFRLASPVQL